MRKLTEKYKWLQLVFGLVLLTLGVLTIILAVKVEDDYAKTICIVWGVVLFLVAALIITFDFIGFRDNPEFGGLIIAGVLIGFGVFVLAKRVFIREVINSLLPYVLISVGGVLLLKTIFLAVKRVNFKVWVLPFILSVIFLSAGIIFICVDEATRAIYVVVGVLFIVLGALEMVGFVTYFANKRAMEKGNLPVKAKGKKKKEKREEQPEEVIEVEAEPKQIEQEDDVKLIENK